MGFYLLCACGVLVISLFAEGRSLPASQARESDSAVLKTLRVGHPRLVALPADIERVRRMIRDYPQARQWHEALVTKAKRLLEEPPVEYKLIGPRLLQVSRQAVDRIYTPGVGIQAGWRQTLCRAGGKGSPGDRRVRGLAPQPLSGHGRDDSRGRNRLRLVLRDTHSRRAGDGPQGHHPEGTEPCRGGYRGDRVGWWARCDHNWNQVCNGGIGIGALAIADEEPELAAFILNSALASLPKAMRQYGPDGGWAEGPGYWGYATRYTAYFLAAMESALGTDFGLSKTPGFDKAGEFRFHFVGPTGLTFNYADAHEKAGSPAEMFWLARRFDQPLYAWHARQCKPTAIR
jgi:hypothetical protein